MARGASQRPSAAAKRKDGNAKPVASLQSRGRHGSQGMPWQAFGYGVLVSLVFVGSLWLARQQGLQLPSAIRPLAQLRMKELPELLDYDYRGSMLWGSYRSGLYFGMRTRTEQPLLLGLMWFDPGANPDLSRPAHELIRHEAQQSDGLTRYGWLRHDGRSYGRQELIDGPYNISVQMVKAASDGSGYGGDWGVRLQASLTAQAKAQREEMKAAGDKPPKRRLCFIVYIADSNWDHARLFPWPAGPPPANNQLGPDPVHVVHSANAAVGSWALLLQRGASKASASAKLRYLAVQLRQSEQLVMLRQYMLQAMLENLGRERPKPNEPPKLRLPNAVLQNPNTMALQLTFVVGSAPAEFDLTFVSKPESNTAAHRVEGLSGAQLARAAAAREADFDRRFAATFPAADVPAGLSAPQLAEASKAALSNLLGSTGYFYGASRVRLPPGTLYRPPTEEAGQQQQRQRQQRAGADGAVVDYWADSLFTATPSRSFFPRGFLWDEGFHQLAVARWDGQLSRDAIGHWLDLMNADGWIPREQILGAEARARVPPEFVVQDPSHANPPSLFLPLLRHAAAARGEAGADEAEAAAARAFLLRAWPRLGAWYRWFNTSQAGVLPGTYMWKGRNATTELELNPKTLMSGLDDYPRASHPSPDERHVDLLAWMALASRAMADIGASAGAPARQVAKYASAAAAIGSLERLRKFHYHEASGAFRDYGRHTEAVALVQRRIAGEPGQPEKLVKLREVNEEPTLQLVPDFGYVSLFPLLMQLLPPGSDELGRQLVLLRDEGLLWTQYGLRSLAPTSRIYREFNTADDAPYWRGQVWVNINYLTLRALSHYSATPGPHAAAAREAYVQLRANLLKLLVTRYDSSGFLWEQYDDLTGTPKGSHPFTGWTALLTLVAAEAY